MRRRRPIMRLISRSAFAHPCRPSRTDRGYLLPSDRLTFSFTKQTKSDQETATPREEQRELPDPACAICGVKTRCASGKERRITRWVHEHVLEERAQTC